MSPPADRACDQIASPTANGLFEKAISVSGEYNAVTGAVAGLEPQDCKSTLPTLHQATTVGADFAAAVGVETPAISPPACEQCPPIRFFRWPEAATSSEARAQSGPTLNGSTLEAPLRRELATGAVNKVPVIAGVDRDENLAARPIQPVSTSN